MCNRMIRLRAKQTSSRYSGASMVQEAGIVKQQHGCIGMQLGVCVPSPLQGARTHAHSASASCRVEQLTWFSVSFRVTDTIVGSRL